MIGLLLLVGADEYPFLILRVLVQCLHGEGVGLVGPALVLQAKRVLGIVCGNFCAIAVLDPAAAVVMASMASHFVRCGVLAIMDLPCGMFIYNVCAKLQRILLISLHHTCKVVDKSCVY